MLAIRRRFVAAPGPDAVVAVVVVVAAAAAAVGGISDGVVTRIDLHNTGTGLLNIIIIIIII